VRHDPACLREHRHRPAGEEQATAALPANDNLAALSFSHQRLQYELTQIVPLAVIVGVGVVFYLLGGKTRRETAAEPVAPAYAPADHHEPAP
jgi:hypothetical protein